MITSLIKVGNSKGVRIPSKILESLNFQNEISMEIIDNKGILLKPIKKQPRKGWEEAFKKAQNEKTEALIDDVLDIDLLDNLENDSTHPTATI